MDGQLRIDTIGEDASRATTFVWAIGYDAASARHVAAEPGMLRDARARA